MDLISKYSPSASVSPPISPIKLFSQPTSTLPPLKNLPVWNRPGLEKSRFIRSITKDSPEIGKAELILNHLTSRSTQTSPPCASLSNNVAFRASEHEKDPLSHENTDKSLKIADKRLYFMQAEHEIVLKKLHAEIEKLTTEKKELNFKFVMTKNGISVSTDNENSSEKEDSTAELKQNSETKKRGSANSPDSQANASFNDGGKNCRVLYRSRGTKNPVLETKRLHRMKSGSKSAAFSSTEQAKIISTDQHFQKVLMHCTSDKMPSVELQDDKVKYSTDDYEEIIRGLQKLNARQASELNHLKEKLTENMKNHSAELTHVYPENRLPRIPMNNTIKSAKMPTVSKEKPEILTLPTLRPQKFGNRQRKAHATHMQRQQRLSKEFVQQK